MLVCACAAYAQRSADRSLAHVCPATRIAFVPFEGRSLRERETALALRVLCPSFSLSLALVLSFPRCPSRSTSRSLVRPISFLTLSHRRATRNAASRALRLLVHDGATSPSHRPGAAVPVIASAVRGARATSGKVADGLLPSPGCVTRRGRVASPWCRRREERGTNELRARTYVRIYIHTDVRTYTNERTGL